MGRERARQLVVAQPLEVAGGGEVPRPAVAEAQRGVGDLADERLDERVLAALGRARVDLDVDQVAAGRACASRGSSVRLPSTPETAARASA